MARKKKSRLPPPRWSTKKQSWDRNHYVRLHDDLLTSTAYINLSLAAKAIYTILLMQYKGPYSGSRVKCPYSTFEHMGIRRNTASKALVMLEQFGFIKISVGGLMRTPSEYTFSDEWQMIRTSEDVEAAKQRTTAIIQSRKRTGKT